MDTRYLGLEVFGRDLRPSRLTGPLGLKESHFHNSSNYAYLSLRVILLLATYNLPEAETS